MEELSRVWPLLRDAGSAGMLVFILYGGYRRWWVWGYQLAECRADYRERLIESDRRAEEWKEIARPAARTLHDALELVRRSGT